jgi:hypothetical protein
MWLETHTPLRCAAAAHDVEMLKFLLARGGDPNLPNGDGLTAVAAAANSRVYGGDAAQFELPGAHPDELLRPQPAHRDPAADMRGFRPLS